MTDIVRRLRRLPAGTLLLAATGTGPAAEPKRYFRIQAQNHRFDGNQQEFYRRLEDALQWVEQAPR
jgi:hypothetical protein